MSRTEQTLSLCFVLLRPSCCQRRVSIYENILVANAASSSVKFQVFAIDGGGKLPRALAT
jgi:hypothetical protein